MSDLLDGVNVLSRQQLQTLCEFELPRAPKWQLGRYTPPGPIGAAYIQSQGPIDAIMGPGGSGKTVASAWKGIRFSLATMPICRDGRIRVKGTVVRDNYRSLYRTTLQSWFEIFPPEMEAGVFSGGQDRPAVHVLSLSTVRTIDGVNRIVPVDLRVEFFAIADVNYELLFKSYETSWAWATEADGVPVDAIPFFFSRTARYPALPMLPEGTVRPRVAFLDFNPPAPKHPLYQACLRGSFREDFNPETERKTVNFFRQPGGLEAAAENRAGKSRSEYEIEAQTLPKDIARRMVHGLPGRVKDGLPVYDDEFDEALNVAAQPLEPIGGLPLHIGFDQGGAGGSAGSPGAVLFQVAADGQVRVLDECIAQPGTGVERFLDALVPKLSMRFRQLPLGQLCCDPSGFTGGDRQYGTLAWADIVSQAIGHRVMPAPTNEFTPRRESLGVLMGKFVSVGKPRLIIDARCRVLIDALGGEYRYGRRHDGTYDPQPIKNFAGTAAEALQYGVLGVFGLAGTISALAQGNRARAPRRAGVRQGSGGMDWNLP
jgi:hypothetical protein